MEHYIRHEHKTPLGGGIFFMEKEGKAFAHMYWFDDDPDSVFLEDLSVSPEDRKNGMGTELQKIREWHGIDRGAKEAYLWVIKDTWMVDWYKRRGYEYHGEKEDNAIWLKKDLI